MKGRSSSFFLGRWFPSFYPFPRRNQGFFPLEESFFCWRSGRVDPAACFHPFFFLLGPAMRIFPSTVIMMMTSFFFFALHVLDAQVLLFSSSFSFPLLRPQIGFFVRLASLLLSSSPLVGGPPVDPAPLLFFVAFCVALSSTWALPATFSFFPCRIARSQGRSVEPPLLPAGQGAVSSLFPSPFSFFPPRPGA